MIEPTYCAACGQPSLLIVGQIRDGGLAKCSACKTVSLKPGTGLDVLEPADYGEAYRHGADPDKTRRLYELFRQCASPASHRQSLLDVGFGDGAFLSLARHDGWATAGVDSDPRAVSHAQERGIEATQCVIGRSAPELPTCDVVTLWDVIEHVRDAEAAAAWLARVVRPGGMVIVLTPNADSMLDRLAWLEFRLVPPHRQRLMTLCVNRYHVHRFTAEGLRSLFRRFGFSVRTLRPVQLLSLRPERYLDGFAPGITGWTRWGRVNRGLSRVACRLLRATGLRNKILYVGTRCPAGEERAGGRESRNP